MGWYVSTVYGGKVGDIVMVIVNGVICSGLLLIVCGMVLLASRARQ